MKAYYLGRVKHKYDDGVDLIYKYKGYEYMICDNHNGYSESLSQQHEEEQSKIDKIINMKSKENKNNEPFNIDKIYQILDWE